MATHKVTHGHTANCASTASTPQGVGESPRLEPGELQFRHLLETLPAAAYTCDAEGHITYYNAFAVQLWGRAPRLNDPTDRFCGSFKLFSSEGAPIAHGQCWMALALQTGEEFMGREIVIERPDGSRVVALAHAAPIRDPSGTLVGASNVLIDITERRRDEFERTRLAAIVDSAEDAIISKNLDGIIQSWNQAAERIFGYTDEEAIGRPISILIPPERQGEEQGILARIRRGERVEHYETVRLGKDGRRRDIALAVSPIKDSNGRVVGASKIARDITERKAAAETLRRREEELKVITDAVPALIAYVGPDLRYRFNNLGYATWFGRPHESFEGKHIREVLGEANFQTALPYAEKALRGETVRFEGWLAHPDGARRYVDVAYIARAAADGSNDGFFVLVSDLTAREQAEEALRAGEARYRSLFETTLDGIMIVDESGHYVDVNDAYCRLLKASREEVAGSYFAKWVPPERLEAATAAFADLKTSGSFAGEFSLRAADGAEVELEWTSRANFLPGLHMCAVRDITARKQAEKRLHAEQAFRRAIELAVPEGVAATDLQGRQTYVNPAFCRMVGWSEDELLGATPPFAYWPPEEQASIQDALTKTLEGQACPEGFNLRFMRKDGSRFDALVAVSPLLDANGSPVGWVASTSDITQRVQAEKALRQSEERYRSLVGLLPAAVYTCDANGTISFFNARAAELWGRAPRLGDADERFCGSFRLWRPDGSELRHADTPMAKAVREGRSARNEEVVIERPDGSRIWVSVNIDPLYDDDGRLVGAINVFQDFTERKQSEEALRRREEELKVVTDTIPALVAYIDRDLRYRFNNLAYETWFSHPRESYTGRHMREVLGDAAFEALRPNIEKVLRGESVRFETWADYREGGRRYIDATYLPRRDAQGEVEGFFVLVSDLTARKRAEDALRESEARFRGLADGMPHMVWETDAQGINHYQNEVWYDYIGEGAGSSFGEDWLRHYHPDDRDYLKKEWTRSLREKGAYVYDIEVRIRRYDGVYRWFRVKGAPVRDESGKVLKWVGTCTDIDDQKRAEHALRESEERFRTLADNMAQFAWAADETGSIYWYNQRWFDYTGTTLDDMRGWGWRKVHHPDYVQQVVEKFRRCVETGEVWEDTFPLRGRNGEYRWFLSRAVPIRDEAGQVRRWFGTNTDITSQREAEQVVEQLNRDLASRISDLQTLLDVAPIGIAVATDPECGHISINDAGAKMLNTPPGRNVSKNAPDGQHLPFRLFRNSRELSADELPMQVAARNNVEVRDVEIDVVWDDGGRRKLLEYASPLRDERGKVRGCIGIFVDVTDRRQMEEDLLRTQKLESIGVLAGGIAHDFNNILTAVFGNIELAKLYAEGRHDIVDPLLQAEKAFKRARDLTHQLLTFSKGGAPIRKVTPIAELLRESVGFALHGSNVRVEFTIEPDLRRANVDAGQINQAINNLVINAKDAMPEGGRLRVAARNLDLDASNTPGLRAGSYVEITIKDWGTGISDENLPKVFDPYFTTKSYGTGLGLSTVYSIVKRHDGHITVRSRVGGGTTFCMYLPATNEQASDVNEPRRLAQGRGRLLLMDDEESVQKVGKALLEKLGYEVEVARDGEEALARYRSCAERGEAFAAVILDLTIPGGMGGRECLERLKQIDPQVRAFVSSGYFNDPVMSEHEAYGFCGVVPKPYQLADLSEALAKIANTSERNV